MPRVFILFPLLKSLNSTTLELCSSQRQNHGPEPLLPPILHLAHDMVVQRHIHRSLVFAVNKDSGRVT